jgi:integrase/recombinase XerD
MLTEAVHTYLAVRRSAGFALRWQGDALASFAAFSKARNPDYVSADLATEWAGLARQVPQRARRLGTVIRLARYLHAEDPRHEVPRAIFGAEKSPRPTPYIFTAEEVQQLVHAASLTGSPTLRRATYSTFFALLACTGLRVSEAIRLRFDDITPDGLVIRQTKFRKSRLVPLHETARAGLDRYLQQRRAYAPADDHVFVSLHRKAALGTRCDYGVPYRREARRPARQTWPGPANAQVLPPHLCDTSAPHLSGWPRCRHPPHGGAVDVSRS